MLKNTIQLLFTIAASFLISCLPNREKILIFSKTTGYRHKSIPEGIVCIQQIGTKNNLIVHQTEDAGVFTSDSLKQYAAIVFLNTSGDVFNESEKTAFQQYIENGGSFAGVHAASDTEMEWPWFNKLVGAFFDGHPDQCEAQFNVQNHDHLSTNDLPSQFRHWDEMYNFRSIQKDLINVLITIDETSYEGGKNGDFHPMSWYHEFAGGRSFYTALGHVKEAYTDSLFVKHLEGGILYAIGKD